MARGSPGSLTRETVSAPTGANQRRAHGQTRSEEAHPEGLTPLDQTRDSTTMRPSGDTYGFHPLAGIFPPLDVEDVRQGGAGTRATLKGIDGLTEQQRDLLSERQPATLSPPRKVSKQDWVQASRMGAPSPRHRRRDCRVCGRYGCIAHAHHVLPLAIQYDLGFHYPDHDIVWLCPNHHALVHFLIERLVNNQNFDLVGFDAEEASGLDRVAMQFVAAFVQAKYGARIW